jgi:hypothetical protein
MVAGEKNLEGKHSNSKTHVRFGDEIISDDLDIRKSMQKNNAKMINIYLKTPYKVLTINEVKAKERTERERDLEVGISPTRLFRAENNLAIENNYRGRKNYTSKGGKFKHKPDHAPNVNMSLLSDIDIEQASASKDKNVQSARKFANLNNTKQSLEKD